MMTAIRLRSTLMRVMLLAGMIPFLWVSDANAFERLYSRCGLVSVGSTNQGKVIRLMKQCLDEDHRISFYSISSIHQKYKNKIFDKIPDEYQDIIAILNGIDEDYLNDETIKGSEMYNEHYAILEINRLKMDEIFSRLKIPKLPNRCMNLTSTTGCYAEARDLLKLPSVNEIKRRIRALHL